MAHTRKVIGPIHILTGVPWIGSITFLLTPSRVTAHAILAQSSTTVVTDDDGNFIVDLEVNATYEVSFVTISFSSGRTVQTPIGASRKLVVPDGDTPISLMTIWASEVTEPDDPTLVNFVAQLAGGDTNQVLVKSTDDDYDYRWGYASTLPPGGTTGQVLVKSTDDDYDAEWGGVPYGGGPYG